MVLHYIHSPSAGYKFRGWKANVMHERRVYLTDWRNGRVATWQDCLPGLAHWAHSSQVMAGGADTGHTNSVTAYVAL